MAHAGLSSTALDATTATTLHDADESLKTMLNNFPKDPTQAQMLELQRAFQSWTLLVQTLSTCYKELSDAWKGVVQKV